MGWLKCHSQSSTIWMSDETFIEILQKALVIAILRKMYGKNIFRYSKARIDKNKYIFNLMSSLCYDSFKKKLNHVAKHENPFLSMPQLYSYSSSPINKQFWMWRFNRLLQTVFRIIAIESSQPNIFVFCRIAYLSVSHLPELNLVKKAYCI